VNTLFYINISAESGSSSGVGSLNGLTGTLNLVAGSNITITPAGSNITIASTGGSGSPGGSSGQIQYNNSGAFGGFGSWNGSLLSIPALSVAGAASLLSSLQLNTNTVNSNYNII